MSDEVGRSLTREEFDAGIRRAAELAASDPDSGEGRLSEVELYRIAGEVGLSEGHVRTALAEVRTGEQGGSALDRIFGPATVHASRIVPGTIADLKLQLDDFLVATQLLQPVRRAPELLLYQPALDWASQLARAASFTSHKHFIASAKSVEIRFERVDDEQTLIEVLVDPGTRPEDIAGAVVGGSAAGGVSGALVGVAVASALPFALAVGAGVAVGLGVCGGVGIAAGRGHRNKVVRVQAEVEGV
ncbi:MAG: hypothetical protein L7S64_08125, partial [Longimicrobiales bacterium]|nr:hypothetical protein [Longimicrobiales bacterium]